jgi:hypothetical protein
MPKVMPAEIFDTGAFQGAAREALTGERAGQPLSCERLKSRVPTRFETWKAILTGALS